MSRHHNRSIVHLLPHFGNGGDMVVARSIASLQASQGDHVLLNGLPLRETSSTSSFENPFPLNCGWRGWCTSVRNISALPYETDIIHVHSPICLLFAAVALRFRCRDARIVFTFHWPVPDSSIRRTLKALIFRQAAVIHSISAEVYMCLITKYGIPKSRILQIPLGIPSARFDAARKNGSLKTILAEKAPPPQARVIGYLGRLATEKNVDYLIRFMENHHERYPDLHLVIAGTGDLEQSLQQQALSSPAKNHIHFIGYTKHPEVIYPEFDLLVLPSDFEAFPLVVAEAAYCRVPTLRSDAEGSRDQIEPGVSGFLYTQLGGYSAMEAELIRILDQQWHTLPEIGKTARNHFLNLCDMDRFMSNLDRLYTIALSH